MISLACRARKCKHILVFRTIIFKSNFVTSQEQTKPTKVWKESSTRVNSMFDKSPERFIIKYSSLLLHLTLDFFSRFPLSRSPCFMCAFSVFRYHLCIILDPTHHGKRILVQRVACGFMGSDILSSSQEVPTDTNVGWDIFPQL